MVKVLFVVTMFFPVPGVKIIPTTVKPFPEKNISLPTFVEGIRGLSQPIRWLSKTVREYSRSSGDCQNSSGRIHTHTVVVKKHPAEFSFIRMVSKIIRMNSYASCHCQKPLGKILTLPTSVTWLSASVKISLRAVLVAFIVFKVDLIPLE